MENFAYILSSLFNNLKKIILKTYQPKSTILNVFKKFYMSQMNPKEFVHNTMHTDFNCLT